MKLRTLFILLIVSILAINLSMAQKPPMKFGKINIENLKMTNYEKDSSASALILCDFGDAKLEYNKTAAGFQLVFQKHTRIKILNKDGYNWANGEVQLYHQGSDTEKLSQLKGITYNLEDGKVVKTKLSTKSIFKEKLSANRDITKFTLPNVREGSIIEYSYQVASDFIFSFKSWEFQKSIPIVWSEYRAKIPQYFNYLQMAQGYLPFKINEKTNKFVDFAYTLPTQKNLAYGKKIEGEKVIMRYDESNYRWVVENAHAFVEEPYMTTSKSYKSKIQFQLASTQYPNNPLRNIMGTWEKLNYQFLESEVFGKRVSGSAFLKKELDIILANATDEMSKISSIYNYVKKNVAWNGQHRLYVNSSFKDALNKKKGSVAEINLLLTSLLQKAGFDASPVLVSTRDNGVVRQNIPIAHQFNYVICKLELEDGKLLLDATDPYLPMNILPKRCLNGEGWVVSEKNFGWIKLDTHVSTLTQISGDLAISDNGVVSGNIKQKYTGYYARKPRENFLTNGEESFVSEKLNVSKWELENIEVESGDDLSSPFVELYDIEEMNISESLGDKVYINPIASNMWTENPLKLDKREYPVDFAFPWGEKYYVTLTVPSGYEVVEVPGTVGISLPDNAGKFVFRVSTTGNKIIILNSISIKKTIFSQIDYPFLKEFFSKIVAKQKEQIVLKKI